MDCGIGYPAPVMHFHHRAGVEKKCAVSRLVHDSGGLRRIDKEVAKCDLLCANCHALRHIAEGTVGSQVSLRVLD